MNYLLLLLPLIILLFTYNHKENFQPDFCPDCNNNGWTRKKQCQQCFNCGWSIGWDGFGQCIPGSLKKPLINNDTKYWYYGGNKIWSATLTNHTQPKYISYHHTPLLNTTHLNRSRYGYGSPRYGHRFGYGWNSPIYQQLT